MFIHVVHVFMFNLSFRLLFQCKYSGTSVETVIVEIVSKNNPIEPIAALGPINVELRLASGHCQTKGCNEGKCVFWGEI